MEYAIKKKDKIREMTLYFVTNFGAKLDVDETVELINHYILATSINDAFRQFQKGNLQRFLDLMEYSKKWSGK